MFIACPHCHELIATAADAPAAPALCPRCGGDLGLTPAPADRTGTDAPSPSLATGTGTGAHSFASLLRSSPATAASASAIEPSVPAIASAAAADSAAAGHVLDQAPEEHPPMPDVPPASQAAKAGDAIGDDAGEVVRDETDGAVPERTDDDDAPPIAGQAAAQAEGEDAAAALAATDASTPAALQGDAQAATATAPGESAASAAAGGQPAPATAPAAATHGPSFIRRAHSRPMQAPTSRWQILAVLALALLLALQILLADRARLASDARWRPLLVSLCGVLRCELPPWREPSAFAMLDRDVRPLPGVPGTLQARATFRNDARWRQPWPRLLLTLRDADGRTLGARALEPAEYLDDGADPHGIAAGQSAQVSVRIREPSASVVAYSFDFL